MTNEGFQPSEPPTEKKRPGRPRKPVSAPISRTVRNKEPKSTSDVVMDDTLARYLEIARILESLSEGGRTSVMHALVERFGAGS